jgi:hypothetical protein
MDGSIEVGGVGEGVVGEIVRFEIVPDNLDVVEFGRVFWQPLDGEPMLARFEGGKGELAEVDRSIVLDQHDRLHGSSGLGAVETVELLQVSDEVAAALGRAGVHDQLARDMIERPDHRHFFGLSRRRHAQIGAALGPRPRQIRVRQGLALVAIKQDDVAGLGLGLAQLKAQAHARDLAGDLATFQGVPRPPPAEVFFRSVLDNCDLPIRTPSRASISPIRRAIVQLRRLATGASKRGVTTRSAASLFTGAGPGATLAFSASTPPSAKSQRHRRTVSSRTPKASAMRGLVQPKSVSNIARARSASPRSRECANARSAARCSPSAVIGDLPTMPRLRESTQRRNHTPHSLATPAESA